MWNLFHVNSYSQKFQDHPMYDGKTESPGGRRHGFDPDLILANTSPAVIRSVLATAQRTTWLALDCLQLHLARFRQVQPSHPVETEKSFRKRLQAERRNYLLEPWNAQPPLRRPKVRDLGPPTRKEEASVSYELWLLQLYEDVKTAAAFSRLDWPAEDVEAVTFDDRRGSPWHYGDNLLPVLDYLQKAHGQSWPGAVHIPWEKLQGRQREGPAPPTGDGAIGVAKGVYRGSNVLALGDFGQYQHLGFNFWSFERIRLAGFLSHPSNHCDYAASKYHCAWLSVLALDDVAKVVEKRQATVE
ncbi:hypothetical protein PG989_014267 [Apiospora arundinis]